MTILAVDDEPLMLTLMATVLRENGYDVLTAGGAAQAIALFREHPEDVDLLISDVVMPGMDGPSLAAELRSARPDLKVLLVSGYCDPRQLDRGFEFLSKPFAVSELISRVRSLLRRHSRRAAGQSEDDSHNEATFVAVPAH
ncbi:MAG TPA: response regulator [Bryobacteraceae bacterium]|nr:response regulator [Bryobacteraceae bacterium]